MIMNIQNYKTIEEIIEKYKNDILYCIYSESKNRFINKPCKLSEKSSLIIPAVSFFNNFMEFDKFAICTNWEDLYLNFEDALKETNRRNSFYDKLKFRPYISLKIMEEHTNDLLYMEKEITNNLKDFTNFEGIDFCDVSANEIQIRGHHKQIKNYTYGDQPTIKYDFSNIDSAIKEFITMWKEIDNPNEVNKKLKFIREGEKYGWN